MNKNIHENGYYVLNLQGDAVFRLKMRLYKDIEKLEKLDDIIPAQTKLLKRIHAVSEWVEIIEANAFELSQVVGDEMLYQKEPYIRIARSNKPQDNIGIHRDTHYGASPHEWVLWVPLTDCTNGAELRILPGSHFKPDDYYPYTIIEPQCDKGDDKHWLGFRYEPKKMSKETENKTIPIACRVGQAILFNSSCVHGQIVNTAPWTRVSMDIRLVNTDAPIQTERGLHGKIYTKLFEAA